MRKIIYALFLILLYHTPADAQGTQTKFGKNRVQYHQDFDEWLKYESDNFTVYWYGEGRNIGQAVVQLAEYDFSEIQGILEHRINEKIQVIVYTDLTDIKQSNIGSEDTFNNTGGQTKIVGNKVFIFFNGDHNHLRRQIREGIASVYLDAMLFGSNLQEIVQNAVMMNLPDWFKLGLISYIGENWNTDLDNRLRDLILDEDYEGFELLAEEDPKLAGHALWFYISENYGKSTVSNLLYLTRINRSIESGFLYVIGTSYNVVIKNWEDFFEDRYSKEVKVRNKPGSRSLKFKNKRNLPISQLKLSPDGTKVVYITNEIGKYKVYLQDIRTGVREVIFKGGFRNAFQATDYNYPLLAWNPNNQELAIMYEKRDLVRLTTYDLTSKKFTTEELSSQYHRVYSIDYINTISLVFSGTVRGYSDIFIYYTNTRQTERITNDFYDDLDASFVKAGNRKGILFASNRQDSMLSTMRLDSILPIATYDIFYYDLEEKNKELVRVTNTPYSDERNPVAIDTLYFGYLSDQSGIFNREVGFLEEYIHHYDQLIRLKDGSEILIHIDSTFAHLDSTEIDTVIIQPVVKKRAITHQNTNYDRSVVEQHTAPRVNKIAELFQRDGEHKIFTRKIDPDTILVPTLTGYKLMDFTTVQEIESRNIRQSRKSRKRAKNRDKDKKKTSIKIEVEPEKKPQKDSVEVVKEAYFFQTEFKDQEEVTTLLPKEEREVTINTPEKEPEREVRKVTVVPVERGTGIPGVSVPIDSQDVYRFRPGRIVSYRLAFRTDFVTTQLDNSLLFEGLESFASNPDGFGYPPPGILLKANFKDLFEDFEFEGGVRIPTTFNGSEYFLTFKDKKKRLDKEFAIYRRNLREAQESPSFVPRRIETNILLGQFGVRYPLDIFRSVRATGTLRRDRNVQLSTERPTLETQTSSEQRIGLKLEYVFDNTLDVAVNIKNGTRYKVFAEAVKRFDLSFDDGFSLKFNNGFMTVLGFDARHYQRLLKHSVFAVRLAGATSFGSEKNLYYLGGVDNWLFPTFNNDIPVSGNNNYAYQTLASNLRGFKVNIRNGNSYVLLNSEVRIPVFKYISRRIKSSFFRNFQAVGFFDLGTAWEGKTPFSDDNPLNTTVIPNGDLVSVKVNFFRDPIVAGYGVGVRSMLFGYFIRVDYAWGIETRKVQDPMWYISLGMDF